MSCWFVSSQAKAKDEAKKAAADAKKKEELLKIKNKRDVRPEAVQFCFRQIGARQEWGSGCCADRA